MENIVEGFILFAYFKANVNFVVLEGKYNSFIQSCKFENNMLRVNVLLSCCL